MDNQEIVQALLEEFKDSDLTELEIETAELRFRLGRGTHSMENGVLSNTSHTRNQEADGSSGKADLHESNTVSSSLQTIEAPLVGTFYAASSPEAKPFVAEGQKVAKGETMCILEAMKMMNELTAPYDLIVHRILGVNGEMVEYNQVLFEVEEC